MHHCDINDEAKHGTFTLMRTYTAKIGIST